MMKRFNDFYEAYNFLAKHKICHCKPYIDGEIVDTEINYFYKCLSVEVVKVNPQTNTLETSQERKHLNTKTQVWLEFGRAFLDLDFSDNVLIEHDTDLDCSGDTFEEAIIELANLVDKYYHDNGAIK